MIEVPTDKMAILDAKVTGMTKTKDVASPGPGKLPKPDLSKFELDPGTEKLYEQAELEMNAQGETVWFVPVEEWMSDTKNGKKSGATTATDKNGEPANAGDFISSVVNSGESWKVFNVLPNGYGSVTIFFVRRYKMVLPAPKPIVDTSVVPASTPDELSEIESRAKNWVKDQGELAETVSIDGAIEGA